MGALTLKPFAYQARPWELSQAQVFNYFRSDLDESEELVLQIRENVHVLRVQASGWIDDKTRFISDGFRRQRLIIAQAKDSLVSWSRGLSLWWSLAPKHLVWGRVDGWGVFHGSPFRLYQLTQHGRRALTISFDMFLTSEVYHGTYGFVDLSAFTNLALPGCHPYEEEKVLLSPSGVTSWTEWSLAQTNLLLSRVESSAQLITTLRHRVCYHASAWKNIRFYTYGLYACLKASALQKILFLQ
jgi:hypothetical protein